MTLARHLMVDFNQMKSFVEDPLVLDRGDGIRVTDTEGRTYIDGLSGVFTTSLGHANAEIIGAVTEQLGRLAFGAPTMATSSTALALVDRMLEIAPPPYTTMKFLSGGSEATEAALKLARQYHRQTGHSGRYKILSNYHGYHGGTGHALAASGWPVWKVPFEPMAPGFIHLQTPDPDDPPIPADPESAARLYLEMVSRTIESEGPGSVAAIITEPILMSAGVVVPPATYLRGLRELCDRHGILLIYDEIITGFGRTGTWFAAEHSGAWPDIICCGKGVTGGYSPLSIVLMTDRVAAPFWGDPEERIQFFAGHTYGGNPVACAAALAAIDYIVRHGVLRHVVDGGEFLRTELEDLRARHPGSIRQIRGQGLLQGIVFTGDAQKADRGLGGFGGSVAAQARRRGLLLRASAWFIALGPPLVSTRAELGEIVGILDEAICDVEHTDGLRA